MPGEHEEEVTWVLRSYLIYSLLWTMVLYGIATFGIVAFGIRNASLAYNLTEVKVRD